MRLVFADTGYWIAILAPMDTLNGSALEVSRNLGQIRIITTEMVISELLASLSKPPELRNTVIKSVEMIFNDPNTEVVPQTSLQFRAAFDRYKARSDKEWSLTDCASFLVMEQRGIQDALAYDHHFDQAGFKALLRRS